MITWAGYIYHRRGADLPWEVWETLPDGRKRMLGAFKTLAEADASYTS